MVPFLVVKSSIVVTIPAKGDPENADKNTNAQEVAARMLGPQMVSLAAASWEWRVS
jgi:hypothetical protein